MRILQKVTFFAFFVFSNVAADVEVYFFSVRQSSFALAKTATSAVVIDCGTKRLTEKIPHNKMVSDVRRILGDIKPLIFISHQDDDHYCGINEFFPLSKRIAVIVGGGCPKKIMADLNSEDVSFVDTLVGGKVFNSNKQELVGKTSESFISDAKARLNFDLECLLPERKVGEEDNSQSLVFLLRDSGRRVLFTGDATPRLFTELFCRYKDKLDRCDVLVLPHHGTDRCGEMLCFYAVKPELCIVSSNPSGHDGLPMEVASRLSFTHFPNRISYTHRHKFSFCDDTIKSIETSVPLFVTCNANNISNYYKLIIGIDGNMLLRDGEDSIEFISLLGVLPSGFAFIQNDMYKKFEESTFKPTGESQNIFFANFPDALSARFSYIIREYGYNYFSFMCQFFPPKANYNQNNWNTFLNSHVIP